MNLAYNMKENAWRMRSKYGEADTAVQSTELSRLNISHGRRRAMYW